jgi:2-dehydro-3-deoxy-D-arabinonate dehydratase
MSEPILVRFYQPDAGARLGFQIEDHVYDVSKYFTSLSAWLQSSAGRVNAAIEELEKLAHSAGQVYPASLFDNAPAEDKPHWLAPVDEQEVWAAGVTYERSRQARQEEAMDGGDVYARVYRAERPELFFKAQGRNVIGPRGEVGIRADATWSVPEPELAVVMNPKLEVVGFTVGNDMSSRDIEGANPLYLPQAKVYTASCALGPGILLKPSSDWPEANIYLNIRRGDKTAFEGEVHTGRIKRKIDELASYLGRSYSYPEGVVLLTGTGIVPPNEFTLTAGDVVMISIDGVGALVNTVKVV